MKKRQLKRKQKSLSREYADKVKSELKKHQTDLERKQVLLQQSQSESRAIKIVNKRHFVM